MTGFEFSSRWVLCIQRIIIGKRASILEEGRPSSLSHSVGQNENKVCTVASRCHFNALNSVSQNIVPFLVCSQDLGHSWSRKGQVTFTCDLCC